MSEWHGPNVVYPGRVEGRLAIVDVTVIPMDAELARPARTVVVEEGRIARIGPSSLIDVTGMRTVAGAGKYLMPGLTDMHMHLGDPIDELVARDVGELLLYLAGGVTLVRNMWGQPFHLAARRAVEDGALPGPRIVTSSPLIDGPHPTADGKPYLYRSVIVDDQAGVASLARAYRDRGYDLLKAYGWLSLDVLRALGRAAADVGLPVAGHCPEGVTFEQAADAGMSCFEHLHNIFTGRMRDGGGAQPLWDANPDHVARIVDQLDWDSLRRLADRCADQQIWNCPTNCVELGLPALRELGEDPLAAAAPYLDRLSPVTAASLRGHPLLAPRRLAGTPQQVLDARRKRDDLRLAIVGLLHDRGAPLLIGTDAPLSLPGRSVAAELRSFVQSGLTPYEALRCGTTEAARFLGIEREVGTVAEGRRADLILLDANPLDDVTAVEQIAAVLCNGYFLNKVDLTRLLAERGAQMTAALEAGPLAKPPRKGRTVSRGVLTEHRRGARTGTLAYGHHHLPDGSWAVNEVARWHTREKSVHLELTADRLLERAKCTSVCPLGTDSVTIQRVVGGGYNVTITDIDQSTRTVAYGDRAMAASDMLAMSVVLLHIATDDPRSFDALAADGEAVETFHLKFHGRMPGEGSSHVTIDRPREPTSSYSVRYSPSGDLVAVCRGRSSDLDAQEIVWTQPWSGVDRQAGVT